MTASHMLTQEQIDDGLLETRAAIERARKTLERSREVNSKTGLAPEKVQAFCDRLSPRDRVWINTLVQGRMAEITDRKPGATKTAARKPRSMV